MYNLNTHPDFQSHTQPTHPPLPLHCKHDLLIPPFLQRCITQTTHRDGFIVESYTCTHRIPTLIFWSGKLVSQPIDLPIPPYWIPNRTPLRYQIPLPILLSYDSLISRVTPPPPPSQVQCGIWWIWDLVNPPYSCTLAKEEQNNIYPVNVTDKPQYLFRKLLSIFHSLSKRLALKGVIGNQTGSVIRKR